jgi:hypothetical protein
LNLSSSGFLSFEILRVFERRWGKVFPETLASNFSGCAALNGQINRLISQ